MIIRRLIAPLSVAIFSLHIAQAGAQGAFPAPLPNQAAAPAGASPFPPVNGAPAATVAAPSSFPTGGAAPLSGGAFGGAPGPGPQAGAPDDACMKGFMALRQDAEKRGAAIKAAGDRHAPPDEACKLIGSFSQVEVKMVNYVVANSQKCGIPPQVADQLRAGHKNTEAMHKKVCAVAQQGASRGPAGPSLSEVLGSANAAPEATVSTKKSGGSTFDTLNGNVLTR